MRPGATSQDHKDPAGGPPLGFVQEDAAYFTDRIKTNRLATEEPACAGRWFSHSSLS